MPTFFSYILKQKKILFFLVIFFAILTTASPAAADVFIPIGGPCNAHDLTSFCTPPSTCTGAVIWGNPVGICAIGGSIGASISNTVSTVANAPGNALAGAAADLFSALIKVLALIPLVLLAIINLVTAIIAVIAGTFLKGLIGIIVGGGINYTKLDINTNPAVTIGWPIVRDFANILVVLGFIAIALATILRWPSDYDAKKLLPKLIIAALLINFSLVICGIMIDASHIVMIYFLRTTATGTGLDKLADFGPIVNIGNTLARIFTNTGIVDILVDLIVQIIYNITIIFAYILFLFLLFFRIFALWILVILSPLAFVCYALPGKPQQVWSMWWNGFTQWLIIGIPGAFFIFLAQNMLAVLAATPSTNAVSFAGQQLSGSGTTNAIAGQITQSLTGIMGRLIPAVFLILGFIVTLQVSAMGAGLAVAGFNKVKGYAKSGAQFAGKRSADRLGLTEKWSQTKLATMQSLERMGLVAAGTGNLQRQQELKERMKPYQELAGAETDSDVIAQRAMNASTTEERAAYSTELHKRKKLDKVVVKDSSGKVDEAATRIARQKTIDDAKAHGVDVSEWAKTNYQYGEFVDANKKNIERIAANKGTTNLSRPDVLADARQEQLEENLSSMSAEQRRNIDIADLTDKLITSRNFSPNMIRNFRTADRAHISALKNPAMLTALRTAIRAARGTKAEQTRLRNIAREINNLP